MRKVLLRNAAEYRSLCKGMIKRTSVTDVTLQFWFFCDKLCQRLYPGSNQKPFPTVRSLGFDSATKAMSELAKGSDLKHQLWLMFVCTVPTSMNKFCQQQWWDEGTFFDASLSPPVGWKHCNRWIERSKVLLLSEAHGRVDHRRHLRTQRVLIFKECDWEQKTFQRIRIIRHQFREMRTERTLQGTSARPQRHVARGLGSGTGNEA